MKRRIFLKTMGGAAGAALTGCSTSGVGHSNSEFQKKALKSLRSKNRTARRKTNTYGLGDAVPKKTGTPFDLHIRMPGWFPDAADFPDENLSYKRLFAEEVVARKQGSRKYQSFPVHLKDPNEASKNWVLGAKLKQVDDIQDAAGKKLTEFVRAIAVRVRQYNASLYRLRRLHFYWDHKQDAEDIPTANPWETHPPDITDPDEFPKIVSEAEADWLKVTNELNHFLETTGKGAFKFTLLAADMVSVNGYIMSMRIVVQKDIREAGGSSSHVSISSPFSSSTK
jgi:hypothetical protein